ncbi:hypothetical protein DYB30_011373 [Aphanomyces astaci]|uniref:Uncharacterized protein n=1 Tax=Aphanomyces astaci TaxID=112090 RepID=A0A397CVA9_APHAT|nr:hypothetical protein DYB30_011373 [Aphanomyces astaci]RHY59282.1 hypothetical protein DYB38_009901 [Aphanomyces astaci]
MDQFLISEKLAAKYACVVFLIHGRFEVHPSHKVVGFLTWNDLQFFAALLMGHWVAPSIKRHHSKLQAKAAASVLTESSSLLCLRRRPDAAASATNLLSIGAGLSQPKELKDLIEDLVDAAGIVFKDSKLRLTDIDVIFSALIDSLGAVDVWYLNADDTRQLLLASWELFLSVCRAILITIYDRI